MSEKQITKILFRYIWKMENGYPAKGVDYHGLKVFSCFSSGGGSTMGYKLAGYDVIGCNEIDPKVMKHYIKNHNPKHAYLEPIQDFKKRNDLPKELYELDILDGSPPCSSFSLAGNREKDWGKEKRFREGQAKQVLDTLFFDFIDLAKKLQPKVVVAENVKGLLFGEAKRYVVEIYKSFEAAGYMVQHVLLDSSKMGVPQKRQRVFFIALRKDLAPPFLYRKDMFTYEPKLELQFDLPCIKYGEIADYKGRDISANALKAWNKRLDTDMKLSESKARAGMKENDFNTRYLHKKKVPSTILAKGDISLIVYDKPIYVSKTELIKIGSFPLDYEFIGNSWGYLIGMSVPPVMMANLANQIYKQWLSKI